MSPDEAMSSLSAGDGNPLCICGSPRITQEANDPISFVFGSNNQQIDYLPPVQQKFDLKSPVQKEFDWKSRR